MPMQVPLPVNADAIGHDREVLRQVVVHRHLQNRSVWLRFRLKTVRYFVRTRAALRAQGLRPSQLPFETCTNRTSDVQTCAGAVASHGHGTDA